MGGFMQNATEFGKEIRGLLGSDDGSQVKFANELGISPAILSNYLTGKTIPKLDFVSTCIEKFGLDKMKSANLYFAYFLSAVVKNSSILPETRAINPKRIDVLAKAMTILLLYPETTDKSALNSKREPFETLEATIGSFFNELVGIK